MMATENPTSDDDDESSFPYDDDFGDTTVERNFAEESQVELEEIEKVVQRETKLIGRCRWAVSLLLMALGAVSSVGTYFFVSQSEESSLEVSFHQHVTRIVEFAHVKSSVLQESFSDFSDIITASALDHGDEFPFVTVGSFGRHGENFRKQTDATGVWIAPTVTEEKKDNWTTYSVANSEWYGREFSPLIYHVGAAGERVTNYPGTSAPAWQSNPLPVSGFVNLDLNFSPGFSESSEKAAKLNEGVLSSFLEDEFVRVFPTPSESLPSEPFAGFYLPVYSSFNESTREVVGTAVAVVRLGSFMYDKMAEGLAIHVVLQSSCNDIATWELQGWEARFLGLTDAHDSQYEYAKHTVPFTVYDDVKQALDLGVCVFNMHIYPTATFADAHRTGAAVIYTVFVMLLYMAAVALFFGYDWFQKKRNQKVIDRAVKSNTLLTNLFPRNIRDRLLGSSTADSEAESQANNPHWYLRSNKGQLQNFLDGDKTASDQVPGLSGKPIADLFLDTTIMFADSTGFTAWSSTRQPSQVFSLLETIFAELDNAAKRRRVFKVETVGDCYVAVAGLPEPRSDHAVVMARFARETQMTVLALVKRLEMSLGPDTAELGVRIGLHSGPCTAGVLRGDKARFQLFGDAVNTAALIESTGAANRIHMSKETADLLAAAGKGHWVRARKDSIPFRKGKETSDTFWLQVTEHGALSSVWADAEVEDVKLARLIDWQVDVFTGLLKQVVARRNAKGEHRPADATFEHCLRAGEICLDEVQEIIRLPKFDARAARNQENPEDIMLEQEVIDQLRDYISKIAYMYRTNDFHNFQHACHVSMSVTKLLSRIVMPSDLDYEAKDTDSMQRVKRDIASSLHDHTYGITSDPLTQFALVFSAMIHDVDHTGVPNAQLVKENPSLASVYRGQSVAEQNSIDLAWNLLQGEQYRDLQACIYATQPEFERFRQLVVQAVLATDIADKELKVLRNARWDNAFSEQPREEPVNDTVNRKATIVIEHLIQASDVAHTMQHWHVYRKWNESFFRECYLAYKEGRANSDPAEGWYRGEIGFFDFYIIPLAKKLKKCGVFGVSSDEYLNYALKNRREWENRGKEVVEEMVRALAAETQALPTLVEAVVAPAAENFADEEIMARE